MQIAGYYDHLPDTYNRHFVILPPGYAETKRDYISLSYYLVTNGLNVIRYDHSCHTGESDGEIIDTDPIRLERDLASALDVVERQFGSRRCAIIASSLLGRIALRLATKDARIKFLVNIAGIVDFQKSLFAVYQEDIIGQYKSGSRWNTLDILGHEVRGSILEKIVSNGLDSIQGTVEDVRRLQIPVLFIAAERDVWVNVEDIKRIYHASPCKSSGLCVIPKTLHQIQENPRRARYVICKAVASCLKHLEGRTIEGVKSPDIHDIADQNRKELAELKRLNVITKESERKFWDKYLSKHYSIAYRAPDFRDFLDCTCQLLGGIRDNDLVLDAGCGSGLMGLWILKNYPDLFTTKGDRSTASFGYVGVDFSKEGLFEALKSYRECIEGVTRYQGFSRSQFQFVLADLESGLPFQIAHFNKIVCNLVVSYLSNANQVMSDLTGLLCDGGKIVVSSLKPHCDLSLIYHNYVRGAVSQTDRDEAKMLLSSTGQIRKKEGEGHYHFYTEDELEDLLRKSGARRIRVVRSLGDQANIAVGEK